ncbi:MAG: sigma-54 dependent transcriptional regulator [Bacillota bacterium]|nr:sigma-54 dependent transcriptional regulator [Bacillota bacterium]
MKKRILILDDEKNICSSLTYALEDQYIVFSATNPVHGLEIINSQKIDLVLLDLKIGKVNGLDVLKEIKEIDKNIAVIMMTAYGTIESAVEAIKNGAFTYITKPLSIDELLVTIMKGLEYQFLNEKVEHLNNELKERYSYKGIIGKSPAMQHIFQLIDRLKDVDTNVLITGESGTGKELVARAIHYSGIRRKENFVAINCAAIPDGLLESELFGHKKGAFTGAEKDKIGKFEFANKGTILLDEIGDMSLNLQSKLLRVLEQREYNPLGSNEVFEVNARVIASTNKDLRELMDEKKFRDDLYFRLNVVEINIPPLRDRRQDLPLLFAHFLKVYNDKLGKQVKRLAPEVEELLLKYSYPGNVRELANIIEYGVLLARDDAIVLKALPDKVRFNKLQSSLENEADSLLGLSLKEIEKLMINKSLELNNGNRKTTAQMLGISERGLRNKIKEYDLKGK